MLFLQPSILPQQKSRLPPKVRQTSSLRKGRSYELLITIISTFFNNVESESQDPVEVQLHTVTGEGEAGLEPQPPTSRDGMLASTAVSCAAEVFETEERDTSLTESDPLINVNIALHHKLIKYDRMYLK